MTKKNKLTLKHLIENKDKITKEKKETQELYVEELDATITIEKPERSLVLDALELAQDENHDGNGDDFLVYNIVKEPNLKDEELQKAYGCVEPSDVVHEIFSVGTITSIAQAGMELAGYN